jgi:serine/threonine protein kinase
MGTVYLARSTSIGGFEREVALKVMHAHLNADPEFATDLLEEAKLTVRIRHPNVVSVLDVGEDPYGIYLVMDYVAGDTLGGIQKRAMPLLPRRIGTKLLLDALAGLHAAHEMKDEAGRPSDLVHRDFSPQNILVGTDGIGRLTDFGVAKAATRVTKTSTGIIKGKIAYMSPEQARGETIDRRTDVWAAGIVAWQVVTGHKLYAGSENEAALLLKVATKPPPRARQVDPSMPAALDDAIARALAWNVDDRFPTAQAFRQALASASAGDIADTEETSDFVTKLVAPALEEQRRRIVQIAQLRKQVGSLAATPPSSTSDASAPPADAMAAPTITATRSNVSTDLTIPNARRTPRAVVIAAAGTLAIAAITTGIVVSQRHARSNEATRVAPAASQSIAVPPSAPSAAPSEPVVIDLPDTPSATATARPKIAGASLVRHVPSATATTDGILPASPYHVDAGARHR